MARRAHSRPPTRTSAARRRATSRPSTATGGCSPIGVRPSAMCRPSVRTSSSRATRSPPRPTPSRPRRTISPRRSRSSSMPQAALAAAIADRVERSGQLDNADHGHDHHAGPRGDDRAGPAGRAGPRPHGAGNQRRHPARRSRSGLQLGRARTRDRLAEPARRRRMPVRPAASRCRRAAHRLHHGAADRPDSGPATTPVRSTASTARRPSPRSNSSRPTVGSR